VFGEKDEREKMMEEIARVKKLAMKERVQWETSLLSILSNLNLLTSILWFLFELMPFLNDINEKLATGKLSPSD
jgi:hypothetical protein